MNTETLRDYSKRGDTIPVPNLVRVQRAAYDRFLQTEVESRSNLVGLESLFREVFPIESYDGSMKLEYVSYYFGEPQHTELECRELRLTYGLPLRVRLRLKREGSNELVDEDCEPDSGCAGCNAYPASSTSGPN